MIKFVIKRNNPDDFLLIASLLLMVVIYFGISIYFAKKDRICQNPAKLEWMENEIPDVWTGVNY